MKVVEIPLKQLKEASWNSNQMDEDMLNRLKESLARYGLVEPLVVKPLNDVYEVLSGNQRFKAITEIGFESVPCVIVKLNDSEAMLLAQALNGIRGQDDLAIKGSVLKSILANIPESKVLSLLPETTESLRSLSSIGELDLAEQLQAWQQAQSARLRHMQLQLTDKQLEVVEEALSLILPKAKADSYDNPNLRSNAIFLLCKFYLERRQIE